MKKYFACFFWLKMRLMTAGPISTPSPISCAYFMPQTTLVREITPALEIVYEDETH